MEKEGGRGGAEGRTKITRKRSVVSKTIERRKKAREQRKEDENKERTIKAAEEEKEERTKTKE